MLAMSSQVVSKEHPSTVCNSAADSMLAAEGAREEGVVKSFNKSKGYGFIRIQSRVDDVYFKTEDLTPRSMRVAEEAPRINGVPISCAPEAFGDSRVRARSVRIGDGTNGAKQPNAICTGDNAAVKVPALEPSFSKLPAGRARPASKKAAAPLPRQGWGVPSGEEVNSRKAELMAMGFSEEASLAALSSGLDFNKVLDTLLSGGTIESLPTTRSSSDEVDSLPTTRECSDDASSDLTSSTGDKSPEAGDTSPDTISEETDEPSAPVATNWETLLGACDPVTSEPPACLESEAVNEVSEAAPLLEQQTSSEDVQPGTAETSLRQLARVECHWPEDGSSAGQLSVRSGAVINIWTGTETENGWIYAERLNMGGLSGWIPTSVLTLLPLSYQWRRVTKSCPSFSDLHFAAEQGDIVLVDAKSTEQGTDGGWIYAENLDGAKKGWFATAALELLPTQLQWMHAVNSLEAQHETQTSVEEGDMLLVDPESRTKEGWAYAWAADRCHGDSTAHSAQGWVPVNCLEWPSA